jgi:anti-sigma regulatory factor (Ser/Thr protein kinase)
VWRCPVRGWCTYWEREEGPVPIIHHSLPSGHEAGALARGYVKDDLTTALRPSKVAAAELMTSELVANAVEHAGLMEGDLIGLDIRVEPETVRVSVVDGGPGMDPDRPILGGDTGGWGFVLVDRVSDRWGIHRPHPHSVWFELDR